MRDPTGEAAPAARRGRGHPENRRPVRLVGGWWGPAVGLSTLGLVSAFELDRTSAGRDVFFNVDHPWRDSERHLRDTVLGP